MASFFVFFQIKSRKLPNGFVTLLKKMLYIILILGFIQLIFSFFDIFIVYSNDFIKISETPFLGLFTSEGIFRMKSIFSEPSWYAITIVVIILILSAAKKLTQIDLLISTVSLLLTFSLTGIAGSIIVLTLFLYGGYISNSLHLKSIFNLSFLLIILVTFILIALPERGISYLVNRVTLVISGLDSSTEIRFSRANIIVNYIFKEIPLFGSGIGNEGILAEKLGLISINSDIVYINNYYQYLIITTGLVGTFIFFLSFIILIINDLKKSLIRNEKYKNFLIITLVIFIIFNIFTNGFVLTPIFWIPLGILLSISKFGFGYNKLNIEK
jgi:hypothetical protein